MSKEEVKNWRRKLKKARDNGKLLEIHECCCSLAAYLSEEENHEEALTLYKESLKVCESLNYKEGIALANRMIAEESTNLGYFDDALKYVNIFLDYAKKENNKIEEQRGFVLKGHVFFTHAEYLIAAKSEKTSEVEKLLEQSMASYRTSFAICVNQLTNVSEKERNQMKARLLQNKSLVLIRQNKLDHAQNHLIRAIKICAKEKLKDTECLCYLTLGDLYIRKKEYHNALNVYDKAFELSNTSQKRIDALLCKAKTYILLENFEQTKVILKKAYKIRPDFEIKKLLKQIFAAIKLEKQLCLTSDTNLIQKLELHNKLGKIYYHLQLYKKSIKSYLNMLGCIQKMECNENNLANCYKLLGKVFAKDGQYDKALFYCNQEIEISLAKTPETAGKTYLKISKLHELNGSDFEEIYLSCDKAKTQAEKFQNFKLQVKCLSYLIEISNKFSKHDFVECFKKQLEILKQNNLETTCNSDSSVESLESGTDDNSESNSNADINELLDESEVESEEFDRPKKERCKRKRFYLRRNEKGETDLHLAAIKGNYRKAKTLIDKGHPINIRDTAGWTPLHEACNHGYIDVVNLLLDFGADINDKGGPCCDGITPLHDAATNGQLEIVDTLIKRGASTLILNNLGQTPLQCLLSWRKNSALDLEEEVLFKNIVKALKSPLDSDQSKWKTKYMESPSEKKSELVSLNTQNKSSISSNESDKISKFCKSITLDKDSLSEDSEESDTWLGNKKESAFAMYKNAIKNLRRKPKKFKADYEIENCKPALIDAKHYIENCIIDDEDLNDCEKIKFKNQKNQFDNDKNFEFCSFADEENLSKLLSETKASASSNVPEESPNFEVDCKLKPWLKNISSFLVEDGFEKTKLEGDKEKNNRDSGINIKAVPSNLNESLETLTPMTNNSIKNTCKARNIIVKIFNENMIIPLNELEINSLKIDWVIKKVAQQYPIIQNPEYYISLRSEKNPNIKTSDTLIELANENLEFSILKWKSLPLNERYEKICQRHNEKDFSLENKSSAFKVSPQPQVVDIFKKFSNSRCLTLSNLKLTSLSLIPICKAVAYESFIQTLNLRNNYFGDKGMELIITIFERCVIEELNVSGCNITSSGIYLFSQALNTMNSISKNGLEILNFSNNLITDEAVESLNNIVEKLPNLTILNIEDCELETLISNDNSPSLIINQGNKFIDRQTNSNLIANDPC